jgi:hypothetical protein
MIKELREKIITELESYYAITGAEEFYLHYLLAEARVLTEDYLEIFYKDLKGIITDTHITYSFQVFIKKLLSLIKENYKIE